MKEEAVTAAYEAKHPPNRGGRGQGDNGRGREQPCGADRAAIVTPRAPAPAPLPTTGQDGKTLLASSNKQQAFLLLPISTTAPSVPTPLHLLQ